MAKWGEIKKPKMYRSRVSVEGELVEFLSEAINLVSPKQSVSIVYKDYSGIVYVVEKEKFDDWFEEVTEEMKG